MSGVLPFGDPGAIKSELGSVYEDAVKTIDSYPGNGHFHSSIHGAEHSKRVLLFALLIADQMDLSEADKETLATAAAYHDTQRYDDWLDAGHGARAADAYLSALASASRQNLLAADIMRYHDLDDSIGEHAIGVEFGDLGILLFRVFKDADGLDRFRLGENALDKRFLRTTEAKELIELSRTMNRIAKVSDNKKKALVIVDVQNDFITGSLASPDAESKTPGIFARAYAFDGVVLVTRDTHDEDYLESEEGRNLPIEHCIRGTEGWGFPAPLQKMAAENEWTIYEKPTFGSVQLAQDLADMHVEGMVDSVELIGFCTDICVVSNALLIKAFAPELKVIVDSSLCSGTTKDAHDAALETMKSCQIEIKGE